MVRSALVYTLGFYFIITLAQVKLPIRVGSIPSGSDLKFSDLTYLGTKRMGGWGKGTSGAPIDNSSSFKFTGCLDPSGNFKMMATNQGTGSFVGAFSFVEFTDDGLNYNNDWHSAGFLTEVGDWGYSNANYDMWHGKFASTYFSDGSLGNFGNPLPAGIGCHSVGGNFYAYINYGLGYGFYPPLAYWTTAGAKLVSRGSGPPNYVGLSTTAFGPFRLCIGVYDYGGSLDCGAYRTGGFMDGPDGKMAIGMGSGSTQQFHTNKGPSLFSGLDWITESTPSGFGSPVGGNPNYRTTDLIPNRDYMAYYSLDNFITADGHYTTPANRSARRFPHTVTISEGTFTNYTYQGGTCRKYGVDSGCAAEEIDPNNYGGVGGQTSNEGYGSGVWIGGTKTGYIANFGHIFGPVWYKTVAGQQFNPKGTGTFKVLARNFNEAYSGTPQPVVSDNTHTLFRAQPAYYTDVVANVLTVKYQVDGPSQSISCTASGHDVTVHLGTNSGSAVTSTANNVVSIVNGTSACNSLMTASLQPNSGGFTNDGTGIVAAQIDTDIDGTALAVDHKLWLAHGAQLSPVEGIETGVTVTGPNGLYMNPGLAFYHNSDLEKTPDYSPDPAETIYLPEHVPNWICSSSNSGVYPDCNTGGGMAFDPNTRKLYLCMGAIDTGSPVATPIVYVWQVGGTALPKPEPLPELFSAVLAGLILLTKRGL